MFLPSDNSDRVLTTMAAEEHTLSAGSLLACGLFVLGKLNCVYVNMLEYFTTNRDSAVDLGSLPC